MKICNFKNVYIKDAATVVGKLEGEGPLGSLFDMCESDSYFGKDSWEEAEAEMCGRAVGILLGKTGTDDSNVELMLGGDLLNQCTATGFTAADFPIPYLGLYGACSTAAEGMLIGGAFVSGGFADNAITLASSHFCSSERQFRYPLEYGSLRTPTAQNTVTGAGAFMLTNEKCDIRLSRALAGKVKSGELEPDAIDEAAFAGELYTAGQPDVDLLIRTSGEMRLSNFLPWQTAYTEMVFEKTYWPDYDRAAYLNSLRAYSMRKRRFGNA